MELNLLRLFQSTNPETPLGGRYKIISQLGAGGFGQTFLAEDLHLPGRPRCVVKQLKPQVSDALSLQTARRLFDTEAKVLYQLGNHDQIPRLMAHFEQNQEFYLTQELIPGQPLTQELVKGQPWSVGQTIALLQDILQVLTFVHQQNVIHRDIKPSNLIRRERDGKIVLIDFGAVKQVTTHTTNPLPGQTNLTISIGTQGYVPKEQLGGHPRFSSDVYAVGMIGIQALTGVHPRLLTEDPQTGEIDWRDRAPQVSPELADVLDCMIRYDFRARYATAAEALEALRSLPAELLESVPPQEIEPEQTTAIFHPESQNSDSYMGTTVPERAQSSPNQSQRATRPINAANSAGEIRSSGSIPTIAASELPSQKLVKPLAIVAVLVAVGTSLAIAKVFLLPQLSNQTVSKNQGQVANIPSDPTASLTPATPIEGASPVSPTQASPSLTPNSTSPANSTQASPSPTSNSSASTTKAPSPATSGVEPAPSPATSAAKPAPSSTTSGAKPAASPASPPATPAPVAPQPPKDTATAETYWKRCYDLNVQQQAARAIVECDRALALNPNYPEALWSKGAALEQQGNPLEALKLYEQAIQQKPGFAEAWNNRGTTLLKLGRANEAVSAYEKAIEIKPDFANAWANQGAALWEIGRFDQAIASMDKAIQLDPNNQDAIKLRQLAREKLGH
ncbi:MAG TPA: serine/threonine protein kinase [Cyanobacteria bacterium UBA8803]|nr:serine/threonine protein kinase [Cyanobacteria bacterium UBA9273]HBL60375.1 serine/threonine protein kinase [Cyanobacteria bacterium UBA8803]